MGTKYQAPQKNYFNTTLNGAISDTASTITLNSVTNLQAPGYLVINREDGSGNATPTAREVISFTGISGSDITGVTREADGSTARSHSDGALVESMMTVGVWNSLVSIVDMALDNEGGVNSANASITTMMNVSGASVLGLVGKDLFPTWTITGTISGATTSVVPSVSMPEIGTFLNFSVTSRTIASSSSIIMDINKNTTSIFDTATRLRINDGDTFASTASIKTPGFAAGDVFTIDFDAGDSDMWIEDLTIVGRAK